MTRPRFSMQPNAGHFIESYDKDTGLSVVLSLFLENQILEMSSAGDRILGEYCPLSDRNRWLLVGIVVAEMMKVHG